MATRRSGGRSPEITKSRILLIAPMLQKSFTKMEPQGQCTLSPWKGPSLAKLNSLLETVISVILHTNFGFFWLCWVSMMSYIQNFEPKLISWMSAKKWAIICFHRRSGSWDIPLSAAKTGVAIRKCMEMAILALDEELQEIVLNQKCSPECQLKVEPSTAFIGCQILEIFHFL